MSLLCFVYRPARALIVLGLNFGLGLGLSFGLGLSLTASPAQAQSAEPVLITQVEGISEYRLANGLRVLLAPDDSKPTTTVNMTYLVGSRHESTGQTGMAHLLEHMMFRGTATTRNALGEFSRRGLRANGTTSNDRTNYFASFVANPDTLHWFLGWQADAMVNSLITREDLDSEMTVVRNEMESGENNPFRMLMQKMQAVAFQWHNYGKSTIGARSDVEGVDIEQLRAFYRIYYQPDNAVLTVAGKFDPQSTLAEIQRVFAPIPRPTRSLPREYTVEPVQEGSRSVTVRRAGGVPLVAAMYHIPQAASPDYIAMELAAMMLADTPSGRLYQALVPTGQAAGVFGFAWELHDPGLLMMGAQLQPEQDADLALQTLVKTAQALAQQPFTEAELARARNQWLAGWQRTYADAEQLAVALSEAIASGDWRLFFLQRDRVTAATLADVQRVASAYLVADNLTSGHYAPTDAPQRAPAATAIDVAALLQGYQGKPDLHQADAFDPTPANIDARTQRKTVALPGAGRIKLALLSKPTRGARVQAQWQLRFGDADSLRGQRTVAAALASLLDHGTVSRSRQQISDAIEALGASVSLTGGATSVEINIAAPGEHLPALVALLGDVLRHPSIPEAELAAWRRSQITAYHNAMSEPQALATRALARHAQPWPADDVRYTPTFAAAIAELEALRREELLDFHARTYGAGNVLFSAVGDFDAQAVEAALIAALADWQAGAAYQRLASPYRPVAPAQFDIDTPDKANAFYLARLPLAVQDSDSDYPALYLANFLLGNSETSRLWLRVRVREGLSYNVRSTLSVSSFEPSATWSLYAIYAPENRSRLEAAIQEELGRVLQDGFSESEVAAGIEALLNYRQLARAQDRVLADVWLSYLDLDRSFAWSAELDHTLQALDAEAVNRVLRKYLRPEAFSIAVAADAARAAGQ